MTTEENNFTVWVGDVAVAENVTRAEAESVGIRMSFGYDNIEIEQTIGNPVSLAVFMGWQS